jgi:polyisoprenoid-binding protein YceI
MIVSDHPEGLVVAGLVALVLATGPAAAADWQVDSAKSSLRFSGTELGEPFTGRFREFDAAIAFDPAHPGSAHIEVTIKTASAETGDPQRDSALPGTDWFDSSKYPDARFATSTISQKSGGNYLAQGTLTVRGATRRLTLPFHLSINDGVAHATGHLEIQRSDFGVGQGSWQSGQWVSLKVGINIDIVATRAD